MAMSTVADRVRPRGPRLLLGWRRLLFALGVSVAFGSLLGIVWPDGWWSVTERALSASG